MLPPCRILIAAVLLSCLTLGCNSRTDTAAVPDPPAGPANVGEPVKSLSVDEYHTAIELMNRGLAHLENHEWDDAETAFAKLVELVPNSIPALRNLAISRSLSIVSADSPFKPAGAAEEVADYRAAVDGATAAVSQYRNAATSDDERALADLILGKVLVHSSIINESDLARGVNLLQQAADAQPQRAAFRYAVAAAMDSSRDYADSPELLTTLQQTFRLAPQNLFALQRLLQKQALNLRSQNPEVRDLAVQLTDTLESAKLLLAPLNESIRKHRNIDLTGLMDQALDQYDGSNPMVMMAPASMAGNLLVAENATLIDQRRLNKDLLEYVVVDFSEDFLAAAREAGAIPHPEPTPNVIESFQQTELLSISGGVTQMQAVDFDLDGFEDLVVVRNGSFEVWSRGADLQGDWSLLLAAPDTVGSVDGFLLADIDRDDDNAVSELKAPRLLRDRDGDQKIVEDPAGKRRWYDTDFDVVLWGAPGVTVLRNELAESGERRLTVLPQAQSVNRVRIATAADLEADGDLDLVFGTDTGMTLWQNTDGTSFIDVSSSAALPTQPIDALAAVDWDRNIAMDVVAAGSEPGTLGVLENMLHGRFRWQDSETGLDKADGARAIAVGQLDNTGGWDIVAGGSVGLRVTLVAGGAGALLEELVTTTLSARPVEGVRLADFDNDTNVDIAAWSEAGLQLFRGHGDGTFDDISALLPNDLSIRDVAVFDFDDDGDLDIVVAEEAGVRALLNQGGNSNAWITVVARGKPDDSQFKSQRVNMHATGAVIEVRCGSSYQGHVITEPKLHIGLGNCEQPDAIRIIWTDGVPQNVTVPELLHPRIGILAPQILLGSCPYIYTWTGERFEFFSDCLWSAPIGLVQANGDLAPTREWENLLIPGAALAENQGRYILQITEELWEAAYFDQVELSAIDHPADVDIFTNEKVGPPDLAAHKIHTVQHPRLPVSVVDGRGNDLLPGLTAQDGDYVQAFKARVLQGLVDEWTMEFDLGPKSAASTSRDTRVRLFLIGWVFPTDTSLNLAIEQNSGLAPPAPPSIEVPDGEHDWKVATPFIGFPSGKTKAMVVNLSEVLTNGNTRFRLRSSMELYWDAAFFTVGESDAETVAHDCRLLDADLHFRGFSRRIYADNALFRNGRAPEGYAYDAVTTEPRWPAMSGRFTRYGRPTSLLERHDDHLVVMGPGDELTLSFAVPRTPVPPGWKRDFVLSNVGYDKDANLNTISGQSSEPFPLKSMSRYPFGLADASPASSEYRRWLTDWQIRRYSGTPFWTTFRDNSQ